MAVLHEPVDRLGGDEAVLVGLVLEVLPALDLDLRRHVGVQLVQLLVPICNRTRIST